MERLRNSPIIEAILIVEHGASRSVELSALDAFHAAIRDRYPERETRIPSYFGTSERRPEPDGNAHSVSHLFFSRDPAEPNVVQISATGFMFHRLRHYSTFEPFVGEARRIWNVYAPLFASGATSRLSLRYINDIPLPIDSLGQLSTYLRIRPEVPDSLAGEQLRNVLLRVGMKEERISAYGIVTQTFEAFDASPEISLILDMEATSKGPFPSVRGDMWTIFEELRQLKNRLFLESITERTKELFR